MKFCRLIRLKCSEHGSALPTNDKDIAVKLTLSALFFLFVTSAQPSLAGPFGQLQMLLQSIECLKKTDSDYLLCDPKTYEPASTPVANRKPVWDLYDRKRSDFIFDGIEMDDCPVTDVTYINEFIDVDRDGDSDLLVGFKCFKNYYQGERPDGTFVKDQLTYDPYLGYVADSYLAVLINNDGEFELDQSRSASSGGCSIRL